MRLLIFGDTAFAEIAGLYFSRMNDVEVVGHIVDDGFQNASVVNGLRVDLFGSDEARKLVTYADHIYVAATYTRLNRLRSEVLARFKSLGLQPASYISPHSYIDPTSDIGEHVFIFENNVIQARTKVGDNCVLWSGNHIGHHSRIAPNTFISSHVVLSGHCAIGNNCFIGVNATISNNVSIGDDVWIGPQSLVINDIESNTFWRTTPAYEGSRTPRKHFGIDT